MDFFHFENLKCTGPNSPVNIDRSLSLEKVIYEITPDINAERIVKLLLYEMLLDE